MMMQYLAEVTMSPPMTFTLSDLMQILGWVTGE